MYPPKSPDSSMNILSSRIHFSIKKSGKFSRFWWTAVLRPVLNITYYKNIKTSRDNLAFRSTPPFSLRSNPGRSHLAPAADSSFPDLDIRGQAQFLGLPPPDHASSHPCVNILLLRSLFCGLFFFFFRLFFFRLVIAKSFRAYGCLYFRSDA